MKFTISCFMIFLMILNTSQGCKTAKSCWCRKGVDDWTRSCCKDSQLVNQAIKEFRRYKVNRQSNTIARELLEPKSVEKHKKYAARDQGQIRSHKKSERMLKSERITYRPIDQHTVT